MADSLHLQPLCIDSGTLTTRVGFAGGTAPKHSFSSSSGSVKHSRVMAGGALENEPDNVVGEHVQAHPGAYKLTPAQSYNGQINSYSTLKDLHRHAFEVMGLQETAASHPVLLAENVAATNQQPTRNSLAQFLFEEMQSPCLFFAPSGVLSLYAAGCTTGVVLNVGEGASQCSPIYEGLGLSHSLSSTGVAGRRVTKIMQNRLRAEAGLHFTTTAEFQIVRKMKEAVGCVRTNDDAIPDSPYLLPDGSPVNVSGLVRSDPFEVLFNPGELAGLEESSVVQQLNLAIGSADMDLRSTLYENIVLSGGTTLAANFGQRLLKELRQQAPTHTKVKITAPVERINSTWVGGSILASLSTMQGMWISKAQYEETGEGILRVKLM